MSKHKSAEQKLGVSPGLRGGKKVSRRDARHQDNSPLAPPKGTNVNNQYR